MAEYREVRIPTILRVMPLEGYRLRLELGSGSILELDMAGRLGTIRFCPLGGAGGLPVRDHRRAEAAVRQGAGDHGVRGHGPGDDPAAPLYRGK